MHSDGQANATHAIKVAPVEDVKSPTAELPGGGSGVRTFTLYIEDDRYTLPTLVFVIVRDEVRAKEIANGQLAASSHHLTVEVWEDGTLLFRSEREPS